MLKNVFGATVHVLLVMQVHRAEARGLREERNEKEIKEWRVY